MTYRTVPVNVYYAGWGGVGGLPTKKLAIKKSLISFSLNL